MNEIKMILGIANIIYSLILHMCGRHSQATFNLLVGLWTTGWLTN